MDNSKGHSRDAEQGGESGQQHKPLNSMTLQTAPLLPNGTTWTEGGEPGPGAVHPHMARQCVSLLLLFALVSRMPKRIALVDSDTLLRMCAGMHLASGEQLPGAGQGCVQAEDMPYMRAA